ncbi:hypothetical protein HOY82DRAFT_490057, partial [Tuber indicum]
ILGDLLYSKTSVMKALPSCNDSKFTNGYAKYRYRPASPTAKPDDRLSGG